LWSAIVAKRTIPADGFEAEINHRRAAGVMHVCSTPCDAGRVVVTIAIASTAKAEAYLVDRARRGDREAFESLVDVRLGSAFRTAMAILGNEADARDATQDTFVRVWRDLAGLRDAGRFDQWFGRILVNTCRTAARGRSRRWVREVSVTAMPGSGAGFDPPAEPRNLRSWDDEMVSRALDQLSVSDRTLLVLHYYEELSLAEIADRVGTSAKTVKSRLFTARRALERAVDGDRL
jgi:RNA polymerase sigma-70 factor (ECF subfamily)